MSMNAAGSPAEVVSLLEGHIIVAYNPSILERTNLALDTACSGSISRSADIRLTWLWVIGYLLLMRTSH